MICQGLSDKMPAVARREIDWTVAEAAHLRTCADCRAEWTVVSAGAAVGQDAALDADALAARVLERLRTEPVVRRPARPLWLVGLAAAAVIAIFLVPARLPRGPAAPLSTGPAAPPTSSPAAPLSGDPAAPPLAVHVAGLTSLNAAGLTEVLESFDTMWTETSTTDAPSLDDLDPQELEQVRGSWEI